MSKTKATTITHMDFHGGSIPFPSSPLVRSCFRRDVPLATHFFPLLSTIFSPLLSFHSHWNHPNLSPVLPLQPLAVRSTQRARPLRPLPPPPRTGQARPPLSSLTRRTSAVTSMRTSESRSTTPAPLVSRITPSASSDAERPISTPMVPPPLYPASDPLYRLRFCSYCLGSESRRTTHHLNVVRREARRSQRC